MLVLEDRTVPNNYTATGPKDLIADINAANAAGGANTITLVAGMTFTLAVVNNATDGPNGLPVVQANDNLTIVGGGDTIRRKTSGGAPAFRLFDIESGASLSLENMTLEAGLTQTKGGAILNAGTLTLHSVTIQNNSARGNDPPNQTNSFPIPGGTALGGGVASYGALTLDSCTIQNNASTGGTGGYGIATGGGVVRGSGGGARGAGIYVGAGNVTIASSSITGNTAQGGLGGTGGMAKGGGMCVENGTIATTNTITLTSSAINGNLAKGGNGGTVGGNGLGGGLYVGRDFVGVGSTNITLHDLSIGGNTAAGGNKKTWTGQGIGGGIYIDYGASVGLDSFTFSHVAGNHASTSDDDIAGSFSMIP
jgi:hypothetical protein